MKFKCPNCQFYQLDARYSGAMLGSKCATVAVSEGPDVRNNMTGTAFCGLLSSSAFLVLGGVATAQNNQEKGVIVGRRRAATTIQTQHSAGNTSTDRSGLQKKPIFGT